MKYFLLCLLLAPMYLHAQKILLGAMPIIKTDLFIHQLTPLIAGMAEKNLQIELVFSKTRDDFLKKCREGDITLTYAGVGYANILIKQYGFIPLLVSDKVVHVAMFSKVNMHHGPLQSLANIKVYYTEHDMLSLYKAREVANNSGATIIAKTTSDHVIYTVLEQEHSIGITMHSELGLLDKSFRENLVVLASEEAGRVYLLLAPTLKAQASGLQSSFLDFHNNWRDTDKQYHYLNYFGFIKWLPEHKPELLVSDKFQTFLNGL